MKPRIKVYVAGPYSCDKHCRPLGVDLEYMRKGLEVSVQLLKAGYAPFCPWLDYLFQFVSGGANLERKDYYEYSLAWLDVSDIMLVIELRESSVGTIEEIEWAKKKSIPIVWSIQELKAWTMKNS